MGAGGVPDPPETEKAQTFDTAAMVIVELAVLGLILLSLLVLPYIEG
jgi:hypothetical protein